MLRIFYILFLSSMLGLLTSCLGSDGDEQVTDGDSVVDVAPARPLNTFVCDPFDTGTGNLNRTQGSLAQLYYLDSTQPHYTQVSDYLDNGHLVDGIDIFFNHINVPTRPFDRGYVTQSGKTIETLEGDTLYEWFALTFRGDFTLGAGDDPGFYQLAVLSDDGAVLKVDTGSGFNTLIDNDSTHPTRLACASELVGLDEGSRLPYELDYFQGPRYHISAVVMWRKWAGPPAVNDPLCGQQGNSLFFDSTQSPPAAQSAYNDLLARGWKPLSPDNYLLPESEGENPCNEAAPIISDTVITAIGSSTVTVTWTTDIPATSQLKYIADSSGDEFETVTDINLTTQHSVTATGLQSNAIYRIRSISSSTSGLWSESAEQSFSTRR